MGKSFVHAQDVIQILSPQKKGSAGITALNTQIQKRLTANGTTLFEGKGGKKFFAKDRIMQTSNDYELGVMNGEIGSIISNSEKGMLVTIDNKDKIYKLDQGENLDLAYAISIHKSQGSEYPIVIIPLLKQHFLLLQRNLVYTGITRARSKVYIVGSIDAYAMAIKNNEQQIRRTHLQTRLRKACEHQDTEAKS